jgi:m7GpppX diphosphatase
MTESDSQLQNQLNKRMKSEESNKAVKTIHDKKDISLDMLEFVRILNENSKHKMIVIEAKHENERAVVVMEKSAFTEDNVKQILNDSNQDSNSSLRCDFHNDIYGNYLAFPRSQLNGIKTTIIHPATDQHINKYSFQKIWLVWETPDSYRDITLPHIENQQFSLKWVHNILDHKSETERIVCDIKDPEIGFVLLPDMKWDGNQMNNFYLVAICRKLGIKSLRDLNDSHLPLLKNMKTKGCEAIREKYGLSSSSIRVYIHYQPSYYHFHVHFTALTYDDPGSHVERAHLLDTVINNISLISDYYQKSTLAFPLKENDALYSAFANKNLLEY